MAELKTIQTVPLIQGRDGAIRIRGSRVTLDTIVGQFQQGATPEQIQEDYPSLSLREIYSIIAYYLEHSTVVEEYLRERRSEADQTRQQIERQQDSSGLRQRLRQQRSRLIR